MLSLMTKGLYNKIKIIGQFVLFNIYKFNKNKEHLQ